MKFSEEKNNFSNSQRKRSGRSPKDDSDSKESFSWKGPLKSLVFWAVIILAFIFAYSLYTSSSRDTAEISYSEFLTQLDANNVASVTFIERELEGRLKAETVFPSGNITGKFIKFKARIPFEDNSFSLVNRLEKAGIAISAKTEGHFGALIGH